MAEARNILNEIFTNDFIRGVIIGTSSFLFGILVKHFFSMREEMIKRELDTRREEKEFFMELYGHISVTTDLVNGIKRSSKTGETRILSEFGFKETVKDEILTKFKKSYEDFSNFQFLSRKKGYEVFFPPKFADNIAEYSGYLDAIYEVKELNEEYYINFEKITLEITNKIEDMLGMSRKKYLLFYK